MISLQIVLFGAVGLAVGWISAAVIDRVAPAWRPIGLPAWLAVFWSCAAGCDAGPVALMLTWWCACLASIDIGSRRLPNAFTAAGAVGVLVYAAVIGDMSGSMAGAVLLLVCYLVVHLCCPTAFGAGDVKLAFSLGGVAGLAGAHAWVAAALLAPLLTGLVGVAATAGGRGRTTTPHGPAMCVSTLLAIAAVPT